MLASWQREVRDEPLPNIKPERVLKKFQKIEKNTEHILGIEC